MSTVPKVDLRELDPAAALVGEENKSEVIQVGQDFYLSGSFALQVNDARSRFIEMGSREARVVPNGDGWSLLSRPPREGVDFTFNPPLVGQPDASGPWLAASLASLSRDDANDAPVLLSLDDVSISLIPDLPPQPGRQLHFMRPAGPAASRLRPAQGSTGSRFGFWVQPQADAGHSVVISGVTPAATLDAFAGTAVIVSTAIISFRLTPRTGMLAADPLTLEDRTTGSNSLLVMAERSSGLRLNRDLGAGRSGLRCRTVTAGAGWVNVANVHESEGTVTLARLHATAAATNTKIVSPLDRIRFHMPLSTRAGGPVVPHRPHFVYRDPTLAAETAPTPADRQYGVRLRGLESDLGAAATLDADCARVLLHATGRFEFAAGGKLEIKGSEEDSVLAPKPEPTDPDSRLLAIPAAVVQVKCRAPRLLQAGPSPLLLDTSRAEHERFVITNALLDAPPAGTPGTARAAASEGYRRWTLGLPMGTAFRLRVNDGGVFPEHGEKWPELFQSQPDTFAFVEYPGAGISFDPPSTRMLAPARAGGVTTTAVTTVKVEGSTKEILVYSAFAAALILRDKIIEYANKLVGTVKDNAVRFELQKLDDKDIIKHREVDDLVGVFCDESPGGKGDAAIRAFIEINKEEGKTHLVWPFAVGLSILLWDENDPDQFGPAIARRRGARRPGMALDYSSRLGIEFKDFGWNEADVAAFKKEPLLWPRLARTTGAQLDPSAEPWRGVLFRHLALTFAIDPNKIPQGTPFLKEFYAAVNSNLMLEYGWKDETGASWRGGFDKQDGILISPTAWKDVLEMRFTRFTTRGSAGRVIGGEGEFLIRLPKITRKDTGKAFDFTANFSVNVAQGVELERIEVAPSTPLPFPTTNVPGFDAIELLRFSTDLKTLQLTLRLKPSAALAQALPFLGAGQAIDVTSAIPLTEEGNFSWAFTLTRQIQTNLFGKWPLTIEGVSLSFGSANSLTFRARLNLGLPAFGQIGARLKLTERSGSWDLTVELDSISGEIEIGDFKLSGRLEWTTESDEQTPVSSTEIAKGAQRDFWGDVKLETGGLVDGRVMLRIGNQGELSYWIGALPLPEMQFTPAAQLKEPVLLVAHHVDFIDGNTNLEKLLGDAQASAVQALRPPAGSNVRNWIFNKWKPKGAIGTLVAASGFLEVHEQVAARPSGTNPDDFTCFAVTDSGLFRAEAKVNLLKVAPARFALAVNLREKRFTAGIQLPELKYGTFTVRAGQIGFGLGWGDRGFFMISVGWPEPINNDPGNRDWSKSVMVKWDGAFPLNTFWGGMKARLGSNAIVLGFAFRAGWTWEYSVSVLGIAKGSASLGVALGGSVEICFGLQRPLAPPLLLNAQAPIQLPSAFDAAEVVNSFIANREVYNEDLELLEVLQSTFAKVQLDAGAFREIDIGVRLAYFADVWGKASAEIFGITLASIDVGAHAAFVGSLTVLPSFAITRLSATVGMHLKVKIGCVEFGAEASITILVIDGPQFANPACLESVA